MINREKRIVLKSKSLVIISRNTDDMQELIDNEKDEHLKEAYQGMQDTMKEHSGKEMWYCCWKIIKKEDNVLVGGIGLFGEPNENFEVEIGYGINSEFEGNGYTTEAVKTLVTWIFAQKNVIYIQAKTERDNLKSCRVLEKNAFKKVNENNELLTYELVKPKSNYTYIYLSCGLSIGLVFGISFDNLAIGMCIGMGLGFMVGMMLDKEEEKMRRHI